MNTPADLDVESRLRAGLAGRAGDLPAYTDPWSRFSRLERRHKVHRRAMLGSGIVATLAVVGVIGSGLVPLPSWAPAINLGQTASPLLNAPTVGSLASDEAWVDAFRKQVPTLLEDAWSSDSEGQWRVDGAQNVHIVFAGEVAGRRVALAAFPVRLGVLRENTAAWFRGTKDAAPMAMEPTSTGLDLPDPYTSLVVLDPQASTATVVAAAPAGSVVEFSVTGTIRADGTFDRTWLRLPRASTGEYLGSLPWSGAGAPRLRVTLPGRTARVVEPGAQDYLPQVVTGEAPDPTTPWAASVAAKARQAGLDPAHQTAADLLPNVLFSAGLDPATTRLRILWAGTSGGSPVVLVTAQPDGGGVLVLAVHADRPEPAGDGSGAFADGSGAPLRLVAPANGATTRPYAWRITLPGSDSPDADRVSRSVAVVVPEGTARAEIVTVGGRIPVALDDGRYGTAALPGGTAATVVASRADGQELGATPVPPPEVDLTLMPGDSPATSVVLAEKTSP